MTPKTRAELALLATTLIWGNTFVAMKFILIDTTPLMNVATRFSAAGLIFLVLFGRVLFPIPRPSVAKGAILGLFLFLGFISQNIGLQYTTASKSAFITGMMVVFVPLLQIIVERRAPKLGNIVGVALVAVGLWFLTSPSGSEFNIGDALTIGCAIVFAVYIVYLDVISKEMTAPRLTFLQIASCAVYGWIAVLLTETPTLAMSSTSFIALAYLTLLATVLTTYVQTRFQKDTTPTKAAIIFSIEPVIASVSAYFILGEELGAFGILGGSLIVGGVLVSELSDSIPILDREMNVG
jgi:drug/metabolite transporter (DMT)-like permease